MNKNKGLGLILAFLGIVIIVGITYLYVTHENKWRESPPRQFDEMNADSITPAQYYKTDEYKINNPQANCDKNSPSAIKLISPNGGETYTPGQKITVKWVSCNVDPGSIGISLIKHNSVSVYTQRMEIEDKTGFVLGGFDPYKGTEDDGIQEIVLPKDLVYGNYYISISGTGDVTNIGSGYIPEDYSDDLFTIN